MAKNKRKLIMGAIALLGASAAGTIAILKRKKRETVFRETSMDALEEIESFIREDNLDDENNIVDLDMNKDLDLEDNKDNSSDK